MTVHFNRRTEMEDYVGEAFRKVCKIHKRLPDGGVLVFLTGRQEIDELVLKLRDALKKKKRRRRAQPAIRDKESAGSTTNATKEQDKVGAAEGGAPASKVEEDGAGSGKEDEEEEEEEEHRPVYVLPLYAMLNRKAQQAVFKPPPPGHRLVVVATNVAETSVTIPGIRCVPHGCFTRVTLLVALCHNGGLGSAGMWWIVVASNAACTTCAPALPSLRSVG